MTNEELQTLLDIHSSNSFQELQSKTAMRLDNMQRLNQAESERIKTGCSGLGCSNREPYYGLHLCHK